MQRTKSGNLPVYKEYTQGRAIKYTVIRKISGDIEGLVGELKKITSNSKMRIKVGSILISGIHTTVVRDYLYRLGF